MEKQIKNFSTKLDFFTMLSIFIYRRDTKTPVSTIMSEYKRQWRELEDTTKEKISKALRGKSKSSFHKENIRRSMLDYWRTVEHKPTQDDEDSESDE
jgi:hypothetical protein